METTDQGREDEAGEDASAFDTEGEQILTLGDGGLADTELHSMLASITERLPAVADPLPAVMGKVRRIRRRRRIVRALGATTAFAVIAVGGPGLYHRIDRMRHPSGSGDMAAGAPAAVIGLPTALAEAESSDQTVWMDAPPAPESTESATSPAVAAAPQNALDWPSRGPSAPTSMLNGVDTLLTARAAAAGVPQPSVDARQLWAHQQPSAAGGVDWILVSQGWVTTAGATSQAEIILVEGIAPKGADQPSNLSAYVVPIRFQHAVGGTGSTTFDVDQISEFSLYLPVAGELLVLGAPQVAEVDYAADGKKFVKQPVTDGVALFPRTNTKVKGQFVDTVQVRDSKNRALTPPGAWTVPDATLAVRSSASTGGRTWAPLTPLSYPGGAAFTLPPLAKPVATPTP